MSPQIFISYSHADAQFATKLTQDLESEGYDTWLDRTDIKTGTRWDDEVAKGLAASQVLIVLLSKASTASQNVKDEIGYAIDHDRRIVPLLLEPCEIPLRLSRVQYVDFTALAYKAGLQAVLDILHAALPGVERHVQKKERKPMDPSILATTITGLIVPSLAKLGESAVEAAGAKLPEAVGKLWGAIYERFKGNPTAAGAASDLVKNVEDEDNQKTFAIQLKKALQEDPAFAVTLEDLLHAARPGMTVAGEGNIIVGDIDIGRDLSGNLIIGSQNQIGDQNKPPG
jgi:hypothetical protein